MTVRKDEQCWACAHFHRLGAYGQCRREPPIYVPSEGAGRWPLVHQNDWCGQQKYDVKKALAPEEVS